MSAQNDLSSYLFRSSFYSLVELSLLAKMYAEYGLPRNPSASFDKNVVAQVLLQMKASEKEGLLRVAVYGPDPVGFFWIYKDKPMALCVLPDHQGKGLEARLRELT